MRSRLSLDQILGEIMQKTSAANLDINESIIFEEVWLFQELADPNFAYEYKNVGPNRWEFNDKFGNRLGVRFIDTVKYFESYYIMNDKNGNEVFIYDYEINKEYLDPTSFQGNSDEHRSDTICKILLDEVLPKYLINNSPSYIILHPLNEYRHKIFLKCAEVCKERYPQIEVKELGKEIKLINK